MLKKNVFFVFVAILAATAALAAPDTDKGTDEAAVYGEGLTLQEATPIAEIVQDPEAFAGKVVRVEGKITGVCAMMGCWIELCSPEDDKVRVKVDDGVIVFPKEAEGRWAAAEGEVTLREMTREQWVAWKRHEAEEKGETYDDSQLGDGPFEFVQIQGTGAEIQPAEQAAD